MPLPMQDQAAQQVGSAQKRAVARRLAADHDMVAAAGAGVTPVDHEFICAEAALPGLLVDRFGRGDAFAPG